MRIRTGIAVLGLLAAACTTNGQRSDLVITKVIEAVNSGTTTTVCTFDVTTNELAFSTLNPAANLGEIALVVENRLTDPTSINPLLRNDTAQFQPHQVVVNYEVLPRSPGAAPPYGPIAQQVVATAGSVPTGSSGTVAAPLFLPGVLPAAAQTDDFIRVSFHAEGKLVDGSTVKTNEREYLFRICTTCTTNVCL